MGSITTSQEEVEQHRRDMELHRLNAEPRMMLEAEAWSNLNEGVEMITQVTWRKLHRMCLGRRVYYAR